MKTTKILTILVLALGLIVWSAKVSQAAPMGTAFTYQGRLIDANNAADGLYDFQFKLYDVNVAGTQKGSAIDVNELDVIDGYFTVLLDFGSVFDGNDRWLEIGVRSGELNDPNVYTLLSPRQKVTPTPYAIYAQTAGSDNDWMVSGNDMYSIPSGNIGIGTTNPTQKLEVAGNTLISEGTLKIDPTTPTLDPIIELKSDNPYSKRSFMSFWHQGSNLWMIGSDLLNENTTNFSIRDVQAGNSRFYINSTGNVGIGTTSPAAKLEVAGQVKITGGSPAAGKVLTSDSVGLATWTNLPAGGDITAVNAGTGLSGGGTSGDVTLAVGVPLSLTGSVASTGAVIDATNTSTGYGVRGKHNSSGNYGYLGSRDCGVYGHGSTTTTGVYGDGAYGVYGDGQIYGVYGYGGVITGYETAGVYGHGVGSSSYGVYGKADGTYGKGVVGYGSYAATSYDFDATGPGVNYGSTSSIRWKRDIEAIDEPLEKIMRLRGVYFNWDEEHGGHHDVGMIAEEVGKVLPEIVVYEENGIDADGMDYSKTTPLLVEAVKALKTEVDDLRKENQDLHSRLDALEKLVKGVK